MFIYIYKYHRYIHKDFVVVPIDKATGNFVKDFMPLLLLENWD